VREQIKRTYKPLSTKKEETYKKGRICLFHLEVIETEEEQNYLQNIYSDLSKGKFKLAVIKLLNEYELLVS